MGSLPQKLVVHFEGTIWGENCHNFPPDLYNTFICSKTHLQPVNIYTHAVPLNILSGVLRVWHLLWGDELSPQAKYELKPAAIQILELGMYAYEGTKREKGREGGSRSVQIFGAICTLLEIHLTVGYLCSQSVLEVSEPFRLALTSGFVLSALSPCDHLIVHLLQTPSNALIICWEGTLDR